MPHCRCLAYAKKSKTTKGNTGENKRKNKKEKGKEKGKGNKGIRLS